MNTIVEAPTRAKTFSERQLVEFLKTIQCATPMGIVALTDTRALKTNNPYGTIYKLSKYNVFVGTDYEEAVRRQEKREMPGAPATFVAGERRWGDRVEGCPALMMRVDKETGDLTFYLIAQVQRRSKELFLIRRVRAGQQRWFAVSPSLVKPFIPVKRESPNQPLESPIVWRTIAVSSIMTVACNGRRIRVRH